MPAALSPPQIDGFDDVASFAAEHGMTDALFAAYEILDRLYSTTQSIRIELYDDPEDPDWKPIFFVVTGPHLGTEREVELHLEWNRQVCATIAPEHLWRVGMFRESGGGHVAA